MEKIRKKQIIESVLKCIASEGIDNVTLEKTAKLAGVSKGVVAYYFNNKKNLLLKSFEAFLNNYLDIPMDSIKLPGTPINSKDILLMIGKSILEGFNQDEKIILMQFYSKIPLSNEYQEIAYGFYGKYIEHIEKALSLGNSNNEFVIKDIHSTSMQILAILDGFIIQSVIGIQGNYTKYKEYIESL